MLHTRTTTALATFGVLASRVAAQVDCSSNFTIIESSELKELRDNCKTIGGSVNFAGNFSDDIDLTGVEVINGDLNLFECDVFDCNRASDDLIKVSSSTLKEVRAWLQMYSADTVGSIQFPKLRKVQEGFWAADAWNLTDIDITDLTDVGYLSFRDTQKLESVKSNGIRNITGHYRGATIAIDRITNLESIGGLLSGRASHVNSSEPLTVALGGPGDTFKDDFGNFTFGWPSTEKVRMYGTPTITFGGDDTKDVYIGDAVFSLGTGFKRHSNLRNVTLGRLRIVPADDAKNDDDDTSNDEWLEIETVELPFDDVSDLYLWVSEYETGSVAKRFSLPEKASGWSKGNMTVTLSRTKFEAKSEADDEGERKTLWHWPKEMENVRLDGMIGMDLLETFKEQDCRVSKNLHVSSTNDGLDCDKLLEDENITSRVGGLFSCYSKDRGYDEDDAASARAAQVLPVLGLAALAGFFLTM